MNDNIPDKLFIDNQWIAPAGGKTLASINPADESVIGEVACAGEEEVPPLLPRQSALLGASGGARHRGSAGGC